MFPGLLFFPFSPLSDLLWWFCAASPCLPPVLTPHCPPGQGGWCPHGTFQTSCGKGGGPRLARISWPPCGLGPAGGPGPLSWAASSWKSQPCRRNGRVRDGKGNKLEKRAIMTSDVTWVLPESALWLWAPFYPFIWYHFHHVIAFFSVSEDRHLSPLVSWHRWYCNYAAPLHSAMGTTYVTRCL